MIGATFNPTGTFQLMNASFNAKNFPAGAIDAINDKNLVVYWNTVDNSIVAVDKAGKIVYELAGGGNTLVFKANLNQISGNPLSVGIIENTITPSNPIPTINDLGGGTFELEFIPEPGNLTPFNGNPVLVTKGAFAGIANVDLGGNVLQQSILNIDASGVKITVSAWMFPAGPTAPDLMSNCPLVVEVLKV